MIPGNSLAEDGLSFSKSADGERSKPAWGKIIAAVAVLIAFATAWRYTPLADALTARNIATWTDSVRGEWWAPLALIGVYIVGACVLFPRPLLTLASVLTFGVRLGLLYGVSGILAAALATYAVGRLLPLGAVRRIAGKEIDNAAKKAKQHGVLAVFAANMTPVPPFAVKNVIAGALRIRLWEFALGTLLACIPGVIAWTMFGGQIHSLLQDNGELSWLAIGVGAAAVAAFFILTRYFRTHR